MAEESNSQDAIYPSLRNSVVYITGGASGIGRFMVEAFFRQGARVGFIDLDEEKANSLVGELSCSDSGSGNSRGDLCFVQSDLRQAEQIQAAVDALRQRVGPANVLVNNAARDDRHAWQDVTSEYYDERIAVNLKHMFFATQAVAPDMIQAGKGSIINLGSNSWWEAVGGMPVYTTAKAAVHGMTRSFARDLGKHRIRVNTVVPGWVMTDRQRELWVTPESLERHRENQCLPDLIEPEHVVRMVLFLASDDSSMCTANNYMVDAGSI